MTLTFNPLTLNVRNRVSRDQTLHSDQTLREIEQSAAELLITW